MSVSLPGSTAPLGAAPRGVAPSGVMTELGQVGAAPEASATTEAGGLLPAGGLATLPVVGGGLFATGAGMGVIAVRKTAKAEKAVRAAGFQGQELLTRLGTLPKHNLLKFGGLTAAVLGGGLLTLNLFKGAGAKGQAAQQGLTPEQQQQLLLQQQGGYTNPQTGEYIPTQAEVDAKMADADAAMARFKGGGGVAPATGQAPSGTNAPAASGTNGQAPASTPVGASAPAQAPVGSVQAANGVQQPGSTSLVGAAINLASGIGANGASIAAAGNFVIDQELGTFPSAAAASAAIHTAMADLGIGMNDQRFAIVQSGNTFRAVHANASSDVSKPLTAQQGAVVQWDALSFNSETGLNAYSWNQQRGAVSQQVRAGEVPFVQVDAQAMQTGGGQVVQSQQQMPLQPAPPGAPTGATVTGGGAAAPGTSPGAAPFDPNSILRRTITTNAMIGANGAIIAGGPVQIQGFINASAGGFRSADEASRVAQQLAPSIQNGNPFARVISMQGADGNFYLYAGSVVARPTAPVQNALPVGVFAA